MRLTENEMLLEFWDIWIEICKKCYKRAQLVKCRACRNGWVLLNAGTERNEAGWDGITQSDAETGHNNTRKGWNNNGMNWNNTRMDQNELESGGLSENRGFKWFRSILGSWNEEWPWCIHVGRTFCFCIPVFLFLCVFATFKCCIVG